MNTFAQRYPFFMYPATARELLALSQRTRKVRQLNRAIRDADRAMRRFGHAGVSTAEAARTLARALIRYNGLKGRP